VNDEPYDVFEDAEIEDRLHQTFPRAGPGTFGGGDQP
jgi:hypothetical protein